MPTLRELEAEFIQYQSESTFHIVDNLAVAQGIIFLCPLCFINNKGSTDTHSVHVTFKDRGVPDGWGTYNKEGQPTHWSIINGSGLDDLQLSPSIFLEGEGCGWHGFVGNSGVPTGHAN